MFNNIKRLLEDDLFFYTVLIVVVSILSFGLGRWSMQEVTAPLQPAVTMTTQSAKVGESLLQNTQNTARTTTQFVASKNGTKYHLLTCPGAKQMKEENKVYFNSVKEATAAGYTPAANCKF